MICCRVQWRAIQKRGALKLQDFFWEWSHWSTGKNLTLHWCQYQQSNISSIFFCDMYFYQVYISYIVQYISTLAPGKICWAHGSNCYFSYRWLQNSSMFALSFLSHRSLSQSEQEEKKSCITPPPPFFFSLRLSQIPVERRTPPPSSDVNVRGFTEENLEFMNHQSRQAHFVPALGNVVLQTNKTYMVFFLTCMNRRPVQFLKIRISNQ